MKCCREWFSRAPEQANVFERFTVTVMEIGWTSQERIQESVKHSLHHLLWQYRCQNATDPRDKVHALLSFLGEEENLGELAPNYALSKKEVFKNAVMYDVRTGGKLSILQGRRQDIPPSSDLPSWIYDWSTSVDTAEWLNERQRLRNCAYKASGDESASNMCDDNHGLNLDGIFVDTVCFVRPAIQGNDIEAMIAGILAWLKMAKDKELYDKSRDALSAFWRVVT